MIRNYLKYRLLGLGIIGCFLLIGVIEIIFHHSPSLQSTVPSAVSDATNNASTSPTGKENTALEATIKTQLTTAYMADWHKTVTSMNYGLAPTPAPLQILGVKVTEEPAGGNDVHVDMTANPDETTAGRPDMYLVYTQLYPNNPDNIDNLSVSQHTTIKDSYGQNKNITFMTTSLDKNTAGKINWNAANIDEILLEQLNCTSYYNGGCGNASPAVE